MAQAGAGPEAPDLIATMRSISLSDTYHSSEDADLSPCEDADVFDGKDVSSDGAGDAGEGAAVSCGGGCPQGSAADVLQETGSCELVPRAACSTHSSHLAAQIETLNTALQQKDAVVAR